MHAEEKDDYDIFLDTFDPSSNATLQHANLSQYSNDAITQSRLLQAAHDVDAPLPRAPYVRGTKALSPEEESLVGLDYFSMRHATFWQELCERLTDAGVDAPRIETYRAAFSQLWVKGRGERQKSKEMRSIAASLVRHDIYEGLSVAVINKADPTADPLFTERETAALLAANSAMLDLYAADYLRHIDAFDQSINSLYVRRGVNLPHRPGAYMEEFNYLSSYSIALTAPEQFAQTYASQQKGSACLISTALPNVQSRVVAFAPFIQGMTIGQLELVVAPPTGRWPIRSDGVHGTNVEIHEYSYG